MESLSMEGYEMRLRDLPKLVQGVDSTLDGLTALVAKHRGRLPILGRKPKSRYNPGKQKHRSMMK